MERTLVSLISAIGLFIGMVVLLELGRQLGRRRHRRDEEGSRAGLGAVEGAVFALMGLLIAFTFSGAASRFDGRREMIIEEANAIGTAWLRLDLLPVDTQADLRASFRNYLDYRIRAYAKVPDMEAVQKELDLAAAEQAAIWRQAVAACKDAPAPLTALLIPALNQMFDVASARLANTQLHPPPIIFLMLAGLALMSSLLAGYAMAGSRSRSWIHILGFALIMAATVYVILDLEFPRLGVIRIDSFDQLLVDVRRGMD
jgi:hypothetical protein